MSLLPVQVGTNRIGLTSTDVMALFTTRLEEASTLASVTCGKEVRASLMEKALNRPGAKGIAIV